MKPVKVFGDYVVCFEAEQEEMGMRHHFIDECGWTQEQYREIRGYAWFSAKVTLWKAGIELAAEYLGCCCYETDDEFWTKYECDYFCDMVHICAEEVGDPTLITLVNEWRTKFREAVCTPALTSA